MHIYLPKPEMVKFRENNFRCKIPATKSPRDEKSGDENSGTKIPGTKSPATKVPPFVRTDVERRPCHKGISYNRSCTKNVGRQTDSAAPGKHKSTKIQNSY